MTNCYQIMFFNEAVVAYLKLLAGIFQESWENYNQQLVARPKFEPGT